VSPWLAYGLLGAPLSLAALPIYVHLPHLYAHTHGLALAALGAALLACRALDAVVDPALGRLADRCLAQGPRRVRGASAAWALALLLGFVLLFLPPPGLAPAARWAQLLLGLMVAHVAWSALVLLHQAWAARQGGGALAQSRWVAAREGLGLLGVLLASALPVWAGWSWTTGLLTVGLALGLALWWRVPDQVAPAAAVPTAAPLAPVAPWRVPAFRRLLAVFVCNGLASAIPATLVLFFIQDRLQVPAAWQPVFLLLYFAAGALTLPLWLRAVARWGLVPAWLCGMALSVLAFSGVLLLQAGDGGGFALICLLSGAALGADLAVPGALLAQLVDRLGLRGQREGAFMGWWALANKMNLALAAGLSLPLLSLWGYAPGVQDPAAAQALALAYGAVPCLLKLLAAALAWRWLLHPSSPLSPAQGARP